MSAAAAIVCHRAIVRGKVQGVGYRAHTLREAARIGNLQGWVRNLPTGEVEILVQGSASAVQQLLDWARKGPPSAEVENLAEEPANVDPSLPAFGIRTS